LPLITGATAVVMKKFHPKRWLELVEKHRVSFGILVSSQLERIVSTLLEEREFKPTSLRKLISSSAPLLEGTRKKALSLAQNYEWEIYETYGTSEIGFASILNMTQETNKWNSVGKPLPYVKVKILCEDKRECPFGEVGEIAVKTLTRFAGYYKMEEKTKEAFTEDGYFLTGDLGYLDKDGYLYFVGRKKEVIITGGINVYPQDVEKVILNYPGVKECAVFGVENEKLGEVVCALIAPEKGKEIKIPQLKSYLRKHLTSYQMPIYIKVVEEIPKNHLGKISRKSLKQFVDKGEINRLLYVLSIL
jgi:long-chain acyl-CoA synthetase